MASPDSAAKSAAASATSAAASAALAATAIDNVVETSREAVEGVTLEAKGYRDEAAAIVGLPTEAAAQAYNIENDATVKSALSASTDARVAERVPIELAADPTIQAAVDSTASDLAATPGTALRVQLDANFAAINSVASYGATGDGVTDDSAAIQDAVDAVRDAVRAGFTTANVVTIPTGRYYLTTTITVPPYIKIRPQGAVIFDWAGGGSTCLHITALSDDPTTLYSGLERQQWVSAPLIDGSAGGLTLRHVVGGSSGAGDGSIGLEIGSRTNLGTSRPTARYSLHNVSIQGFAVGKRMNTYNHYLGSFHRLHIELCGTVVEVGNAGVAAVNAGENFGYHDCTFAGSSTGYEVHPIAWDATFVSCSFDYLGAVARIHNGYGRLTFIGGHIENIDDARPVTNGGIIACDANNTSDTGNVAHAEFVGVSVLHKARRMFRGTGNNLKVDGTIELRTYSGDTATTYPDTILAEPGVVATGLRNVSQKNHRVITLAHNRIEDPYFNTETLGAVAGNLLHWGVVKGGGATVEVVTTTPVAGGQAIQLTLPVNSYVDITALHALRFTRGVDRWANLLFQTDRAGIRISPSARYIGASGTDLGAVTAVELFGVSTAVAGTWHLPTFSMRIADTTAARAATVKPRYVISNPSGAAGTAVVTIAMTYFGE